MYTNSDYSVAPYNFVSLPEKPVVRYNSVDELPTHNSYKGRDNKELLSGYIEYTLKAEMPIIVSAGINKEDRKAEFFENSMGEKAIPGNTIRGMLRTNIQILSFSSVLGSKDKDGYFKNSEIKDTRFLFRDVAGNNSLSNKYADITGIDPLKRIAKNIQAGYITKEGGKYYITPAVNINNKPYIRVDEIHLRKIVDKDVTGIDYLYKEELLNHEEEIKKLKKLMSEGDTKSKKRLEDILENCKEKGEKEYTPYSTKISFDFDNEKHIVNKIGAKGKANYQGAILSGGYILGKMSHYIVGEEDTDLERIQIPDDVIEDYNKDLIMTKKAKKSENGEVIVGLKYKFYELHNCIEKKPIFYINYAGRFHFGFTPYMRLFYSKSVLNGISKEYKAVDGIGYSEAIFGFTGRKGILDKEDSYKSRVSFEDAVALGNPKMSLKCGSELVLAEPKPTSYNHYLKQEQGASKKELKSYEDEFKLRGIKQYWMKDRIIEIRDCKKCQNKKMLTKVYPLETGTEFKGKIYFNNLCEDELGLLLWSLKLEDNCFQSIGLAKPYGYGRVKVKDMKLHTENLQKKYEEFCFDYLENNDIDKFVNVYKKKFSEEYLSGKSIDEHKTIKELIYIKSKVLNENQCRYMDLEEFKDKKPLPEISTFDSSTKRKEQMFSNNIVNDKKKTNKYIESSKQINNKRQDFSSSLGDDPEVARLLNDLKKRL